MGRFDEAAAENAHAQELDPLSLVISASGGWIKYLARRYDRALEHFTHTIEMDPDFALTHWFLGLTLRQLGRHEEAISELETAVELSGGSPIMISSLGHAYGVAGRRSEAEDVLSKLQGMSAERHVPELAVARIYVGLGDSDGALEWLEAAYTGRSSLMWSLNVDPVFDALRDDPRFRDLLERMNFPAR